MDQQPGLNISLDQTKGVKCEKCGNETFQDAFLLRKASRLLTGTAQDALIPIQVFACTKCGHVNEEFLPMQLKQQPTTSTEPTDGAKIIKL